MTREQSIGRCEHCAKEFGYYLVHNGFNDSAYGYCDRCGYTVILSGWRMTPVSFKLHTRITEEIEPYLKPCPCGGAFRTSSDPRCPDCSRVMSASKATGYIEANAAGAAKGWRWDQRWNGIYGIVIENRILKDWWK
jgi:DNA-directed RNA polymerase subunit RPC12/RpoP